MLESVDCWTDGILWWSRVDPHRAVRAVFGGFALYEKVGDEGLHRGLGDQDSAYRWLSGDSLGDIPHYKVEGVSVEGQE